MGEPQGFNRKQFIYRTGNFFLLVGFTLFVFFILSEAQAKPELNFFCWSTILIVLGFFFRAQWKRPVSPSGRFSIFKRLKPKPREEKKK